MNNPSEDNEPLPGRVFVCTVCGWLYEEDRGLPDEGIPSGTRWEDIPEDFVCPECGASKDQFRQFTP